MLEHFRILYHHFGIFWFILDHHFKSLLTDQIDFLLITFRNVILAIFIKYIKLYFKVHAIKNSTDLFKNY